LSLEKRDNAKRSDELKFPRRNLEPLGEQLLAQAAADDAKEPIGR
jgi:hypothetical protein